MLLPQGAAMHIAAEAVSRHGAVGLNLRYLQHVARELPESIVNYVMRSQELVVLDDALEPNAYSEDPYIIRARPRSVLCMPLLKQQQLVGILYIENGLLPGVFTTDRRIVLQILASQAAISIENARLFADLEEAREQARRAEEQTQQLFDLIPTLAWRVTPRGVVDAINKTWTDYTGISSEEAARGEWLRAYPGVEGQNGLNQYGLIFAKGVAGTVETLLRRHDGKVRWFLHRVSPLYDARGEIVCWHGTATDIDDLKRAEALISAEKNLLQMNTDLHTLAEIFEFLVASVEKQIDGSCASLLLSDPNNRRLGHLAVSTLPSAFTAALEAAHADPLTAASQTAANVGQSVLVSEIATAPAWRELRTLAQEDELKVCWSTPIVSAAGATLGVVATYVREHREITHREINVCEQFAHLASIILERKRGEDALKTMNQQLLDSLDEKESLLKEVHHRVKNNLQLISSMLNLQASRITDKSVAELFSESRNRVRSMALVHENLYRAGNFSKISMAEHIETLSASLARAYGLNRESVELVTEVEDILLDLDVAISVGLIINELTSNALKHAFPDGRTGSVRVQLARFDAKRCILTVRDDGIGFPAGFDLANSASMGLQLVQDLAEQLHGDVAVSNDGGTKFLVSFLSEDYSEALS
jgi:PAS domain S-box-containing protein